MLLIALAIGTVLCFGGVWYYKRRPDMVEVSCQMEIYSHTLSFGWSWQVRYPFAAVCLRHLGAYPLYFLAMLLSDTMPTTVTSLE